MEPILWEWLNMAVRWLHVIAGIAWIGSSFYFVHLDSSLKQRPGLPEGAGGEAWQVHGGGFYHMVKYLVAPARMPDELTWFKWEAYATWLSGMGLLIIVYYFGAQLYLIDSTVLASAGLGCGGHQRRRAGVGLAGLRPALQVASWATTTRSCSRSLFLFLLILAFAYTFLFSGRGAMMQMGALVGTMMVANVAMVIIPNQRIVVADLIAGRQPDPKYGAIAKQRSLHNNYLTLPVIFVMIINHYPLAFATRWNWLIFGIVLVIGAVIRHFYNSRHKGLPSPWWTWAVAAAGMAAIVLLSMAGPPGERRGGGSGRAGDLRPGRGGGARALQHVPHGRAGLGGHRGPAQGGDARHARAHPPACRPDPAPGRAHPRHAAGQHHRDHAGGAAGAGGLARRRRQGRVGGSRQ